jgi:ComEC/Rec2-related protein
MKSYSWPDLYASLFGLITGIVYQNFVGCQNLHLCLVLLSVVLTFIAVRNFKSQPALKLFAMFFCLGSISLLAHRGLQQAALDKIKNSKIIFGIVENTQSKETNSGIKYQHLICTDVTKSLSSRLSLINSTFNLAPGQKVLIKPTRLIFFNDCSANTNKWSLREKIVACALPKKWALRKIRSRPPELSQQLLKTKELLLSRTLEKLGVEAGKLYGSVFLGKKLLASADTARELFCIWGLSHFLARSGLHVSIFGGIVWWLLSLVPFLPLSLQSFFAFCMLLIYGILSWPSISFYRSSVILALVMIAKILKQRSNSIYLIGLVTIWVLLSNPFELFCADFQLSFSLALALMIASRCLNKGKV